MDSIKHIKKTNVFISGRDFRPGDNISWVKRKGIEKVFVLYPLTEKQYRERLPDTQEELSLREFHKKLKLDPDVAHKLQQAGIKVESLIRAPNELRGYDAFVQKVGNVRGRILIQCYAGRHTSVAYAMYYLAKTTNMSFSELRAQFLKSGITPNDFETSKAFLAQVGANIEETIARRNAQRLALKARKKANSRKLPRLRTFLRRHISHRGKQ